MSLVERFVKGAGFSAAAAVSSRGIFFANSVILARYLGTASFGVFSTINSLVNSLVILTLFGLNITLTKFVAEFMIRNKEKVGGFILGAFLLCLIILALVCGVYFILSPKLASKLYNDPSLSVLLRISVFSLLFLTLVNLGNSIVQGFQDFKLFAKTSIYSSLLLIPVTLLFLWRWKLPGAIGALAAVFFLNSLLLAVAVWKTCKSREVSLSFSGFKPRFSELLQFALPVFLSGFVVAPSIWLANTFLSGAKGFGEVGVFNVASSLSQLVAFLPLVILTPILPLFSEIQAMGDYQRLASVVSRNLKYAWFFTLPLVILVSSLSRVLILRLYGEQYAGSLVPLFLMLWTALTLVINNVIGTSIMSDAKRIWHAFGLNLFWFLIFLPCVYFLSWWKGALGTALAFLVSHLIFSCGVYLYSVRYLKIEYPDLSRFLGLTLVSAVVSFYLLTSMSGVRLWILTFFWVALLLVLEWKFLLKQEERSWLVATISKLRLN